MCRKIHLHQSLHLVQRVAVVMSTVVYYLIRKTDSGPTRSIEAIFISKCFFKAKKAGMTK